MERIVAICYGDAEVRAANTKCVYFAVIFKKELIGWPNISVWVRWSRLLLPRLMDMICFIGFPCSK